MTAPATTTTKTCTGCNQTKPLDGFYRHRDGHRSRCKECLRTDAHERYARETPEKYAARLEAKKLSSRRARRRAGIPIKPDGRGPLCHAKCKRVATTPDGYCQTCQDELALTGGDWVLSGVTRRWVA